MLGQRTCLLPLLLLISSCSYHSTDTKSVTELEGIDVSHFQGSIQWEKVAKQNIQFVMIKATQGRDLVDPEFQKNWQATEATNLLRGTYHYLDPKDDGVVQAEHFIKTTQGEFGDFSPVVDIEAFEHETAEEVLGVLAEFLAIVEQHSNCKPIIYTSPNFWLKLQDHEFGQYPLWLADYAKSPKVPNGWKQWNLWQYEDNGNIAGIQSPVDRSKLRSSKHATKPLLCNP